MIGVITALIYVLGQNVKISLAWKPTDFETKEPEVQKMLTCLPV